MHARPDDPERSPDLLSRPDRLAPWMALWLACCLVLAYGFDIGRGFIADDYGWIAHHRDVGSLDALRRIFVETPMGFYRPVVSLSFFFNHAMFGTAPIGYALTNLALALGIAAAVFGLTRTLGGTRMAGIFGAGLWMFNVHGVGMALTWISGRTSLLATLFAVLAAIASARRRGWLAAVCTLAALLSKEEPILLPVVLGTWVAIDRRADGDTLGAALVRAARETWPSFVALGIYLGLRAQSTAMTPASAPSYYALSAAPRVLLPNALSYADRAATFAAAVLLLGVLVFTRRLPAWTPQERRLAMKGLTWLVLGFALTVMVPARSDLYACLPSVGVSLIAAALGQAVWRQVPAARRVPALIAAALLPLALLPVYRARNAPNRDNARFAEQIVAHVGRALAARDDLSRVELFQSAGERPSLNAAIGGALPVAIHWRTGRHITSANHEVTRETQAPAPPAGTLHVRIDRGTIVSVAGPQ